MRGTSIQQEIAQSNVTASPSLPPALTEARGRTLFHLVVEEKGELWWELYDFSEGGLGIAEVKIL